MEIGDPGCRLWEDVVASDRTYGSIIRSEEYTPFYADESHFSLRIRGGSDRSRMLSYIRHVNQSALENSGS